MVWASWMQTWNKGAANISETKASKLCLTTFLRWCAQEASNRATMFSVLKQHAKNSISMLCDSSILILSTENSSAVLEHLFQSKVRVKVATYIPRSLHLFSLCSSSFLCAVVVSAAKKNMRHWCCLSSPLWLAVLLDQLESSSDAQPSSMLQQYQQPKIHEALTCAVLSYIFSQSFWTSLKYVLLQSPPLCQNSTSIQRYIKHWDALCFDWTDLFRTKSS